MENSWKIAILLEPWISNCGALCTSLNHSLYTKSPASVLLLFSPFRLLIPFVESCIQYIPNSYTVDPQLTGPRLSGTSELKMTVLLEYFSIGVRFIRVF